MTTKWTAGPWRAVAGLNRWNVATVGAPRTFNICAVNTDRVEQEANARLLAASPALASALAKIAERLEAWADGERIGGRSAEERGDAARIARHCNAADNYTELAKDARAALKSAGWEG